MAIEAEKAVIRADPDESRPILQQSVDSKVGQTVRFGKDSEVVALALRQSKGGVKRDRTISNTKIPADTPPPHHSLRSAARRETLDGGRCML